jgi:uncharacterized protein (TIGR00299 family) protein
MKTLYLECNMGAAGDMLLAALLELIDDQEAFVDKMNQLGIPGIQVSIKPTVKCGISGTTVSITVDGVEEESHDIHTHGHHHYNHAHKHHTGHSHHHHGNKKEQACDHHHASLDKIVALINSLPVSDTVKANGLAVYKLIAEAESHAHGQPISQVHFHEVGTMDAVADIIGVCLLIEELGPERILVSPVHVGSGQVRCAHGILPVPAPATAFILRNTPIYGGSVPGELCTPTGAALLKHFADDFGPMPTMKVAAIGYGMGKKDFAAANCLRAYLGTADLKENEVVELSCNLDDMTPEALAFAQEILLDAGALDVYTTPIGMKKSRPGTLLTCMCRKDLAEEMANLMLRHTTTLGVRETGFRRYTLQRKEEVKDTPYGPIRFKTAFGPGFSKTKAEYEDIAKAARKKGQSLEEVMMVIRNCR